jgi:flavin reductase (DIM6/NTAB) family NADH-FMN oxidoreductase RutF
MSPAVHRTVDLKVQYFGTPVVLLSTLNEDRTPNLAPMSSAWWLNGTCVLGMGALSRTTENLLREREVVVNVVPSSLAAAVDRIALLTGAPLIPPRKAARGYRYEPQKFSAAGLTEQTAIEVRPPRVLQCPIQLECRVAASYPLGEEGSAVLFDTTVLCTHVDEDLLIPGTNYVDPLQWDPLIMKFCEFFGEAQRIHPSELARGWGLPTSRTG